MDELIQSGCKKERLNQRITELFPVFRCTCLCISIEISHYRKQPNPPTTPHQQAETRETGNEVQVQEALGR